ncbi:hypothetical protein [Pseudomonas syringae]|uniref:Uncharacterized protein n=1 Tax=Pseudomonas syringae TaxID=317 RepID=A0A085V689_PSESX|nr:hypothetical protein [Pseudomonas syringae]KFE50952.1 hypothetical protein IV02_16195 [Pseudomonas syringae]
MSEMLVALIKTNSQTNEASKRAASVTAALEVIIAAVANPSNGSVLEEEMSNLSKYADQIQAALKG